PLHVAVAPLGHEGTQSLARRTYAIRCCYSHIDEAKLPSVRNQLVLELLAHFSCVLGGSEIEILVVGRWWKAGHAVRQNGSERPPRLDARVPSLRQGMVLPGHLPKIVDGR